MAVTDLASAIGTSLTNSTNAPGLASPIFSYPGAPNATAFPTSAYQDNGYALQPANGTSTSAYTASTGPTPQQIQAAKDAATAKAIGAGYDAIIGNYDRQLGDIPGQIADAGSLVNSQYGAQRGSLQSGYDRGNANLQYARDQLGTQTNRSISDLARSIRSAFDSYSTLIGARGAGDSSAPEQLSYALQKEQAQQRSDIYRNEGDQLGAIGMKQGDLDAQFNDQVNQLNAWKSQQIIAIGQQFRQMQQQIESSRVGASAQKLQALASLNSDAVNQAMAALSGVEATHQNTLAAIKSSLSNLQAPGNGTTLAAATYTPSAPAVPTAPAYTVNPPSGGDSFATAVPYYRKLAVA